MLVRVYASRTGPAIALPRVGPNRMSEIRAPITGNVWKVLVAAGDAVQVDDVVAILESMKLEIPGRGRQRRHRGTCARRGRRRGDRGRLDVRARVARVREGPGRQSRGGGGSHPPRPAGARHPLRRRVLRGRPGRRSRPAGRRGDRDRPGAGRARATSTSRRCSPRAGRRGCDALHPGYGFLSENAGFARLCAEAGVVFVGPDPEAIEAMGEKTRGATTRGRARRADRPRLAPAPCTPSTRRSRWPSASAIRWPSRQPAAAGGLGFRVARAHDEVAAALDGGPRRRRPVLPQRDRLRRALLRRSAARRGPGTRRRARQRRPARPARLLRAAAPPEARGGVAGADRRRSLGRRLSAYALELARAIGYTSAGTIEGLLVGDEFFFLEMNTRLQVEHPVTELVTGIDLVAGTASDRRRRAARLSPGGGGVPRRRDRVPDQRRGRAPAVHPAAPGRSIATGSPQAPGCGSTPASRRARW